MARTILLLPLILMSCGRTNPENRPITAYVRTDNKRFDAPLHWAMLSIDVLSMSSRLVHKTTTAEQG